MIEPIITKYFKGTRKCFKGTKYYPTSEFWPLIQIDILIPKLVRGQQQKPADWNNRFASV